MFVWVPETLLFVFPGSLFVFPGSCFVFPGSLFVFPGKIFGLEFKFFSFKTENRRYVERVCLNFLTMFSDNVFCFVFTIPYT